MTAWRPFVKWVSMCCKSTRELTMSVADRIKKLADIHRQRSELYGEDYLRVGQSLMAHFPDGVILKTAKDFTRFALLLQAHGKMLRYTATFPHGGHADSLDDLSVYSQLLRHADEVLK